MGNWVERENIWKKWKEEEEKEEKVNEELEVGEQYEITERGLGMANKGGKGQKADRWKII